MKTTSFCVLTFNKLRYCLTKKFPIVILSIFMLGMFYPCSGQNCDKMPTVFSNYEQAMSIVKSSTFNMTESVNTSSSSWIRAATFYSCDSKKGFLIIKTNDREYVHQNVPINIWNGFKKASSYGSYYDNYIKGKFKLGLMK